MNSKRTKIEGLGDVIAAITHFFYIDRFVTFVFKLFNRDCGCERRRKKLNDAVPFKK